MSRQLRHPLKGFRNRNRRLRALGFATYQEYLASPLWKEIREAVLLRDEYKCRLCGSRASQVHHKSYSYAALIKITPFGQIAVCRRCHEFVEFEDGRKTGMGRTKQRLRMLNPQVDCERKTAHVGDQQS